MDNPFYHIREKVNDIGVALLRYQHNGKKENLQVKISADKQHLLYCRLPNLLPAEKLLRKNVSIIQKDQDNYLYVGGCVLGETRLNTLLLSIDVKRASWFVRKRKGSVSWLQEKYSYENDQHLQLQH